jgi:amino acid permease
MVVIVGAFLSGLGFAGYGAYLVYLGSNGETELSLFGQTFTSTNAGGAVIFIAVVMIVLLVRRTLATIDRLWH